MTPDSGWVIRKVESEMENRPKEVAGGEADSKSLLSRIASCWAGGNWENSEGADWWGAEDRLG